VSARVLLIDNHDSFTFNLVQALRVLGAEVRVARNDAIAPEEARDLEPTHLVLSPGPGMPARAGCMPALLELFLERVPILGVCLGHQAIGLAFGGEVIRAPLPIHGKTSTVEHDKRGVFAGLSGSFQAGRYHSLVVSEPTLPGDLEVAARTKEDGLVMGLRHKALPIHGVQFHPESVLTNEGRRILRNFLEM
jgi:anthranilate synthase component 2